MLSHSVSFIYGYQSLAFTKLHNYLQCELKEKMAIETRSLHYAEFAQPVQPISSDWSLKLTLLKSMGGWGRSLEN